MAFALLMSSTIYGVSEASSVPRDAARHNGHRYKVYDYELVWNEAELFCEKLGGHLATITSESEQRFINELVLEKGDKNCYWLGGYKTEQGAWRWITAESPVYSNWANGQPDNYRGKENAGMMYRHRPYSYPGKLGQWNDICWDGSCKADRDFFGIQNFGFICEWEPND